MNNPYKPNEPFIVSFSGGRSSAFMLYHILNAHDGNLPDGSAVVFANTGKEMPQTLDFVQNCSDHWGVDIHWLERTCKPYTGEKKNKKYEYGVNVVTHETASRNGEPFESIVKARSYLPNPVARFCTAELKIRAIQQWVDEYRPEAELTAIGIRWDEANRAARLRSDSARLDVWLPLYTAGVTRDAVSDFWKAQPFDLDLVNDNGVTPLGNCDLCFLKGVKKRVSIIEQYPYLAQWWADVEAENGSFFRSDTPSYASLSKIAISNQQLDLDGGHDTLANCFCGD